MKIAFHGGAAEVGRSCIEIHARQAKILLDAGIKITEQGTEYPLLQDAADVNAVVLSHAHLDHCGALPYYTNKGLSSQIYCTKMTKTLATILLKDSFHVEQFEQRHPAYLKEHLVAALGLMKTVHWKEIVHVNDVALSLFNAGHIPGSSSVLVEADGKRILYSGDINTKETQLMPAADTNYGPVDVLICEGTYGNKDHPTRIKEEARFLLDVKDTLSRGGSALVSVFAVGRAQEVILILSKERLGAPIYLDGMAKKVQARLLEQPEWLKNNALQHAARKVHLVKGQRNRQEIMHTQGVIVSPSGRLEGGPVVEYLKDFWQHEDCTVMLTGYQAEGTNGRLLLEGGEVYIDGQKIKPRCGIKKYDFSSHSGMSELHSYIRKLHPKLLLLNHGDEEALAALAKWAKEEGIDCKVPKIGDVVVI